MVRQEACEIRTSTAHKIATQYRILYIKRIKKNAVVRKKALETF